MFQDIKKEGTTCSMSLDMAFSDRWGDGEARQLRVYLFQVHEWQDGKVIKSKMEIDPATQMDAGYYECQADNKYAVDVKGFSADYSIEFV